MARGGFLKLQFKFVHSKICMHQQILTSVRLSGLLAENPSKIIWLAATAVFSKHYSLIRRRLTQPSQWTAGYLWWRRLSMKVVKPVLTFFCPRPCLGFKSMSGKQLFLFHAVRFRGQHCSNIVVVQHGIVWTKSLQLNDGYSDSVNLSWLRFGKLFRAPISELRDFQMLFCYFIKRPTGNQSIIKTVNTVFVQNSKWC